MIAAPLLMRLWVAARKSAMPVTEACSTVSPRASPAATIASAPANAAGFGRVKDGANDFKVWILDEQERQHFFVRRTRLGAADMGGFFAGGFRDAGRGRVKNGGKDNGWRVVHIAGGINRGLRHRRRQRDKHIGALIQRAIDREGGIGKLKSGIAPDDVDVVALQASATSQLSPFVRADVSISLQQIQHAGFSGGDICAPGITKAQDGDCRVIRLPHCRRYKQKR